MRQTFLSIPILGFSLLSCLLLGSDSGSDESRTPLITAVAGDPLLRWTNGVMWYANQPFSGAVIEAYGRDKVKSKIEYYWGVQNGTSWMWYENGRLLWERCYRNGKKHGDHKGWWPNGQLKFLYHYSGGEYEGDAREWYANGQLAKCFHYEKGREIGLQQAWRENGKLYANYMFKGGDRFGLFNSRLCFRVKDGEAQYDVAK